MPTSALSILILLVASLSAVLAGMGVFSNSRPPDMRMNQALDLLDEVKALVNQLQKSLLQIERKTEKDQRELRGEIKEMIDKAFERVEQKLQE